MPKLRHGSNDCEMFANWLGRKVKNHNPLKELDSSNRDAIPRFYDGGGLGKAMQRKDNPSVIFCTSKSGRMMKITVEEVQASDIDTEELETVAA